MGNVVVGIIMGSDSDLPVMQGAYEILRELDISFEVTVVSAHRTPERMFEYANQAHGRGLKVIIAGAGGAAHLPGMVASNFPASSNWSTCQKFEFHRWLGFHPFHSSNAQRDTRGNRGFECIQECWFACRKNPGSK